jgi:hypothetical protein
MTNKLVVTVNILRVPKFKKILLYEMKFLVTNYSCLQNPWLGFTVPQIPVLSVLCPQLNLLNPPSEQNSWVHHWLCWGNPQVIFHSRRNTLKLPGSNALYCYSKWGKLIPVFCISWSVTGMIKTELHLHSPDHSPKRRNRNKPFLNSWRFLAPWKLFVVHCITLGW